MTLKEQDDFINHAGGLYLSQENKRLRGIIESLLYGGFTEKNVQEAQTTLRASEPVPQPLCPVCHLHICICEKNGDSKQWCEHIQWSEHNERWYSRYDFINGGMGQLTVDYEYCHRCGARKPKPVPQDENKEEK